MSMRAARRVLLGSRAFRRQCRAAWPCLAVGLVTLVTGHARAAETDEPDDLPDVVVTASPLRPEAVVVGGEEIDSSPGESLADVLHWSGVMDVYRRGSGSVQADPGFRASTFEQTGVFVDGVSVRDPQTGHFLLDVPIGRGQLDAVEVSPLAWGPDGLAGSVNLVLKTPAENRLELESGVGEDGLWRTGVAASTPGAGVWGSFEHSDGYRHGTDYDAGSVAALVTSEFLSSRTLVAWSNRRFGANDFYGSYPTYDEWEETETFLATWSGRAESGGWTIRPAVSYRQHRDHFLLDRYGRSSYQNEHSSDTWGGPVGFERELAGGRVDIRAEGRSASLDSSNLGERDWSAGGASASFGTKGDAFDFDLGLRADAHSRFSTEVCP
ncbi:MAG: TonB-dependent receptor plug domain-containing protein, partial [Planctomycetota bacterium]